MIDRRRQRRVEATAALAMGEREQRLCDCEGMVGEAIRTMRSLQEKEYGGGGSNVCRWI